MYYYICYRGYEWNPKESCILFSSCYGSYEPGDHAYPAGADGFGVTIINKVSREFAKQAIARGAKIFTIRPDISIKELMDDEF